METVILIYTTDPWHSFDSRDLIGIVNCPNEILTIVNAKIKKENQSPLSSDDIFNLANIGQTQGYEGDDIGEFATEEIDLNTLI